MLLLMTLLEKPADNERLRTYQRDKWGRLGGETCVIELSGLPASSSRIARDRETFRQDRIDLIVQRARDHRSALVLMYGLDHKALGNDRRPHLWCRQYSSAREAQPLRSHRIP